MIDVQLRARDTHGHVYATCRDAKTIRGQTHTVLEARSKVADLHQQ